MAYRKLSGPKRRRASILLLACCLQGGCAQILGFEEFSGGDDTGEDSPCEGAGCPEIICEAEQNRCLGSPTSLEAQECSSDGTEWESVDLCDVGGLQCSPLGGRCVTLDVDATEVTRQEYGQFLAANTDIDDQPDGCSWNNSFEPDADCMSDPRTCSDDCDDHPQVCVDFCDAAAYCASVGKRLCGGIETGDTVEFESDVSDPGRSEWMNACTSGGQTVFGYGDPLPETEVGACTYDNRLMTTYAVGSRGDCISDRNGYAGTADMSGNVAEWENNCEAALSGGDANTPCHVRGGSFESPLDDIKCKNVPSIPSVRSTVSPTIGLRCCSD